MKAVNSRSWVMDKKAAKLRFSGFSETVVSQKWYNSRHRVDLCDHFTHTPSAETGNLATLDKTFWMNCFELSSGPLEDVSERDKWAPFFHGDCRSDLLCVYFFSGKPVSKSFTLPSKPTPVFEYFNMCALLAMKGSRGAAGDDRLPLHTTASSGL